MKRRLFSLFLALTLVVGMLPAPAFAQETESTQATQAPTEASTPTEAPRAEPTQAPTEAPTEAPAAEPTQPVTEAQPTEPPVPAFTEPAQDEDVAAVQAMIDALPDVEDMSESYLDALEAAYSAFDALSEAQQAQITGVEKLEALFGWVNSQVSTLADDVKEITGEVKWNNQTFATPVKLTGDTTLTLVGDNKIECEKPLNLNGHKLTIQGTGSLELVGSNNDGNYYNSGTIYDSTWTGTSYTGGGMVIESGTVIARADVYNAVAVRYLYMEGGKLEAYGARAGIVTTDLQIKDGSLYATGNSKCGINMYSAPRAVSVNGLNILVSNEPNAQEADMEDGTTEQIENSEPKTVAIGKFSTSPSISVQPQQGSLYEATVKTATFALSGRNVDLSALTLEWTGAHTGLEAAASADGKTVTVTTDKTVQAGTYGLKVSAGGASRTAVVTVSGPPICIYVRPVDTISTDPEAGAVTVSAYLTDGHTGSIAFQWKLEDGTVMRGYTDEIVPLIDLVELGMLTQDENKPWLQTIRIYCTLSYDGYSLNTDTVTVGLNSCSHPGVDHEGNCLQCGQKKGDGDALLVREDGLYYLIANAEPGEANVGLFMYSGGNFYLTGDVPNKTVNVSCTDVGGKNVTLDLQGHTVKNLKMGNFPYGTFTVKNGTLKDLDTAASGKLILENILYQGKWFDEEFDLTVQGENTRFERPVTFWGTTHLKGGRFSQGLDSDCAGRALELLEDGFAFYDSADKVVDATDYTKLLGKQIHVAAHPTCHYSDGSCDCGRSCDHPEMDSTTGKCTVCGFSLATASVAANGTTTYFTDFSEAVEAAKAASGSTLTLFQDVALTGEKNLYIDSGTFTIDWNGHTLSGEMSNALLCITDAAKVTLTDSVGTGGVRNVGGAAIGAYVGSQGSLTIRGGVYSPQLWKDRIAYGPIRISGGRFESPEDSGRNGALYCYSGSLADLLAPGYTFAYEDDDSLFDVYGAKKSESYRTVYAVAHTHDSFDEDGVCSCGYKCPHEHWTDGVCDLCSYECPHEEWKNGKCTVCGYPCPHEDVTENGGVYTCDNCHLTMTVMVETADGISYTTDLAAALNNAEDGTTVKLLSDLVLTKSANIEGGKNVTLNLNGHNITRAGWQTIQVKGNTGDGTKAKLVITGSGEIQFNVKAIDGGQLDMSGWTGSVAFVDIENACDFVGPIGDGHLGALNISNWRSDNKGTILLQGGTIGKLWLNSFDNSFQMPLGSLLESGYAAKSGSEYLPYDHAISNQDKIHNLTIEPCPHTGLDSSGRCTYCNATGFVATVTKDGVTTGYTDFQSALSQICNGKSGTLKLLTHVNLGNAYQYVISGTLDLNGKDLAGKLVCAAGSDLQIVNSSSHISSMAELSAKNGANVTIADTAGSILFGTVTVESGSLADLLPEGGAYVTPDGTWISSAEAAGKQTLRFVVVRESPVKSVTLTANKTTVTYGESQSVTLTASSTLSEGKTASYAWAEVESDGTVQTFTEEVETSFTLPAGVNAGEHTYRVRVTADGYTLSKDIQITVTKAPGKLVNKDYPTEFTYGDTVPTPKAENFTSNHPDGTFSYYWLTGTGSILEAGANPTSAGTYMLYATWTAGTNHTAASLSLAVTIQQAPQTANIAVVNETISGKGDGGVKLLPSAEGYEMRKRGETTFEPIPASQGQTFMTLAPGVTYEIRLAETKNYRPSAAQEVTVQPGRKLTVTLPSPQTGYTLTASKTQLGWHEDVKLTFQLDSVGAYKAADFGIWAKAGSEKTKLTLGNDGAVKLIAPEKDITITVTGVKTDNVAPKVFIQGRLRKDSGYYVKWEGFQENPADDFVNGDFVISATDRVSGVADFWYYLSDKPLTLEELKGMNGAFWARPANQGKVSITEDGEYYLYAKALDKANNAGYACTGKLVKESNPPTFSGVKDEETYYVTQMLKIHDDGMPDWYMAKGSIGVVPNGGNENPIKLKLKNDGRPYTFTVGDRCGNEATITVYMKPLSDLTQPLYSILEDTIRKSDRATLDEVEATLKGLDVTYATEPEKKEINDALARIAQLRQVLDQVAAVEAQIDALPNSVEPYQQTVEDTQIKPARDAYNSLTDHQKTLVDSAKLDKLVRLEAQLDAWTITEGDGQTWYKGSGKSLSFTVNGQSRKVIGVRLENDNMLGKAMLIVSDSTDAPFTIALKPEYLQCQEPGEHSFAVIYRGGTTENVTFTVKIPANYLDVTGREEFEGKTTVTVDGKEYPIEEMGGERYVNLPETGDLLTIYSFKDGTPTGSYTNYPTGMQVFRITRQEGGAKAEEITEFANLLNYAGCSIRVSGKKGIRMITGIDQNVKKSLVSKAGLAGYTLEEYGTVVQWADTLGSNTLNLDTSNKQNYAYKKGKADPIFAKENGMIQYTNVLVGFTDAQCQPDLVMRPYIKLIDTATGETVTLYGGSVTRSIGYVAWQNRDTYKPGTASYKYVWKIIDSVDTSKYPN